MDLVFSIQQAHLHIHVLEILCVQDWGTHIGARHRQECLPQGGLNHEMLEHSEHSPTGEWINKLYCIHYSEAVKVRVHIYQY